MLIITSIQNPRLISISAYCLRCCYVMYC